MLRYQARLVFTLHQAAGVHMSLLLKGIKPVKEIIATLRSGFSLTGLNNQGL